MECFIVSFIKNYVSIIFEHFMVGEQVILSTKSTHVCVMRGGGSKI